MYKHQRKYIPGKYYSASVYLDIINRDFFYYYKICITGYDSLIVLDMCEGAKTGTVAEH